MKYTRHAVAILVLGLALGAASLFLPGRATATLMKPAGIEDRFIGTENAAATLIVYSSPTCGHCIEFEKNVLPALEEKYVKTGKLRISIRPFVLNAIDAVVFLVANQAGDEKYRRITAAYKDNIDRLIAASDREAVLREVAASQGIDGKAFDAAVENKGHLGKLNALRDQATEKFGVTGTPTMFLNGERFEYDGTLSSIEAAMNRAG